MRQLIAVGALVVSGCAARTPPSGILVLRATPPEARVLLDDRFIGSAAQLSGHRLRIHAGLRRVELSADGHYGARREAQVSPTQPVELRIDLHRVPDGHVGD